MSYEIELEPSDVEFLEKLKETKNSVVFSLMVHGKICVMKVVSSLIISWVFTKQIKYHDRGPSEFDPPDREVNLFISESTAYQRMKAKGLCDKGIIPDFYGTIRKIQPASWPTLYMFLNDELPPNAILIEYVPNIQSIGLSTFSKKCLDRLREILDEIHEAKVLHGDPKPRNMMVSLDRLRFCSNVSRRHPFVKTKNVD